MLIFFPKKRSQKRFKSLAFGRKKLYLHDFIMHNEALWIENETINLILTKITHYEKVIYFFRSDDCFHHHDGSDHIIEHVG